jgi:predicted RNase H-like nuclease (RuvC/YqgF family)
LGDIDLLKKKIADLIREIRVFKKEANTISDLNSETHNLNKELIEEKLKVKSLTEELENPMNVHRWRKLEATDSETYELMTKIQSLQKRLIQKTEEVTN